MRENSKESFKFSTPAGWDLCRKILSKKLPFCPHNYQLDGVAVILDGKDFIGLSATGSGKSAYAYMTIHVVLAIIDHCWTHEPFRLRRVELSSKGRKSWADGCNRSVGHRRRVHEIGVTIISTISMLKPPFDNCTYSEGASTVEKMLHNRCHLHFRCKSDLNRHWQSSHGAVGK